MSDESTKKDSKPEIDLNKEVAEAIGVVDSDIPKGKMKIKVYAPFKTYFDGLANSISAENDTGPFDILAGHKNFMTLLNPCELVVRGDEEQKIKISRGIMHVKAGRVTVFLDV